jgi:ribosomal protein S27E
MHSAIPGYMSDRCSNCGEEGTMVYDEGNGTDECDFCGEVHFI